MKHPSPSIPPVADLAEAKALAQDRAYIEAKNSGALARAAGLAALERDLNNGSLS